MSCFRCGKELPEGEVECEHGCGNSQSSPTLCLAIEIYLDLAKIRRAPTEHRAALQKFSEQFGELMATSGLKEFLQAKS